MLLSEVNYLTNLTPHSSSSRTYELSSGKLVGSFKSGSSEDSGMIVNVALDPSNTYLAAAGSDKCIFVHDVNSGERLASLYGHSEMITGLKFTNDCKRLISISGDGYRNFYSFILHETSYLIIKLTYCISNTICLVFIVKTTP